MVYKWLMVIQFIMAISMVARPAMWRPLFAVYGKTAPFRAFFANCNDWVYRIIGVFGIVAGVWFIVNFPN